MAGTAHAAAADCDRPACAVKDDMFAMLKQAAAPKKKKGEEQMGTVEGPVTEASRPCPVDKEELGRGTWALLHTMAAYYPDAPDALHRVQARRFFDALGDLYPCTHCADDYRADVRKAPPAVESRAALSRWLCERHNEVNEKLGKETFPCTLRALDDRWLKGDASCWHG